MGKRITVLLLIIATLLTLSSCSPLSFGKVRTVSDDNGEYHIEYNGTRYNVDEPRLFRVRENMNKIPKEDVLISWFWLGYLDMHYSYTDDNPVFIYISRFYEVYLREDYDYLTDTFSIEGTDHQFVFSDMFIPSSAFSYSTLYSYPYETDITLYSTTCPRLQASLRIFRVNGTWFAGGEESSKVLFEVSDEFLELLNIKVQVD